MIRDPKAYQRAKLTLSVASTLWSLAFLAALQLTPLNMKLAWVASRAPFGGDAARIAAYLGLVFLATSAAQFPFSYFSGFRVEHRFELSTQPLKDWFRDQMKSHGLALALFVVSGSFFFWAVRTQGASWWIWASAAYFVFAVFFSRVFPVWIIPLFYPMKPLPEGELRRRLLELCEKCGVPAPKLYEIVLSKKTVKANAAVVGLGRTRRVIVGDTLIRRFPVPEIEMVMAHELGHHVMKHVTVGLAAETAGATAAFFLLEAVSAPLSAFFGAQGLADPALFPAILLLSAFVQVLAMPLRNGFSRKLEYDADAYAIRRIPSIETFRSLMKRLGEGNMGDPDPHPAVEFVFYSHPSLKHRVERAETLVR